MKNERRERKKNIDRTRRKYKEIKREKDREKTGVKEGQCSKEGVRGVGEGNSIMAGRRTTIVRREFAKLAYV